MRAGLRHFWRRPHTADASAGTTGSRRGGCGLLFLLSIACAFAALFAFAGGARAADGSGTGGLSPSLASDKADYAPGATASLSGGNWLPGEPVHVHVADTGGHAWSFDDDVTAAADGSISDSVTLPAGFSAGFSAIATSGLGPSATTSFSTSGAPPSRPTIVTDQNDYPPGSTVTLTGSNWQSGELVHVFVDDSDGHSWSYSTDVSADSGGSFTTQFQISSSFVATYSVTATGLSGATATTSFTDGNLTSVSGTVTDSNTNQPISGATVTCNTTSGCNATITTTTDSSGNYSFSGANKLSFGGNGPTTLTLNVSKTGYNAGTITLSNVSNGESFTGKNAALAPSCTAPAVTSQPANQTVTYPNSASFTAVASGTAPALQWQVSTNGGTTYTDLSGKTSSPLSFPKPTVSQSGNKYRAVFTNGCGSATSTAATLTVIAKTLTVTGITASNKVYDGGISASIDTSAAALSGVVSGDTVALNSGSASGSFITKTVGTGKLVQIAGLTISGADAGNYTLTQPTTTADITAKGLTVTGITGSNKVYDGNTTATINTGSAALVGVVPGDTVNLSTAGASGAFGTKTVANGKTVQISGLTISGADAANYTLAQPTTTADITAKALSGSFTANNKEYDATRDATVASKSLPGVISGDTVSLDVTNTLFDTKAVGNNKDVTGDLSLSGADAGNYSVDAHYTAKADITAKNLTITGAKANNKTYDSTVAATIDWSGASLNGVISPDDVSIDHGAYSAHFADKNVGTGKPVTVSGVVLGGADHGNYSVSQPSGLSANIGQATLSVSFEAANKVYDATTHATIKASPAPSLVGVIGSDTVDLDGSSATASFATKGVGTGKTVTASGFTKSGADAGNYDFANPQGTASADITPATLSVSFEAANKVYDATTHATIKASPAPSLVGVLGSDTVDLDGSSATASFATKGVGTGKTVTASGFTKSGADAGNYDFANPQGTASADITAKALSGSFTANNKEYDATRDATVASKSLPGVISGDTVSLDVTNTLFDTKAVGNNKDVTGDLSLSGADAGNYSVDAHYTAKADITAKNLTITGAKANNKTYDSTVAATIDWSGASLNGVISPDDVSIDHGAYSAHFADKNVGTGKPVTVSGVVLGGADHGNYSVSQPSGLSANIGQATLDITAASDSKTYDGDTSSSAHPTVSGLQGTTDYVDGLSQAFASKNVLGAGNSELDVTGYLVHDGYSGGNYAVHTHAASGTITQLDLTVVASGTNKTYDGTNSADVNLSTPTAVSGDSVGATYAIASFNDKNVGMGKPISVSGISLGGTDSGNYHLVNTTASTTGNITQLGITGSFTAANKVWDGTPSATVLTRSLNGTIAGDNVSLSGGTATFNDASAGTNKTVTLSGATLSGTDAGNYSLTSVHTTTASISGWSGAGKGFYAPVGADTAHSLFTQAPALVPMTFQPGMMWNTVKGGQTVPLKFNIYAGSVEKTGSDAFSNLTTAFQAAKMTNCTNSADTDPVDYTITATGSTTLRYDTTGMQWIYNWQTPKVTSTSCYRTWVNFADGSTLEAFFQLTK